MSATPPALSARERFIAFRRSLPRPPHLTRHRVSARGLDFAVYSTPEVPGTPPLVCVNGGLLFDHKLLWPALSPLAQRRQLFLYDQRGRGATAAPPGAHGARIEHDAGDLAALRDAIGLRQWDVLGHSWGGGIAMLGAERDRAGVRRLVLVNAVGPAQRELAPQPPRRSARPAGRARARGVAAPRPGAPARRRRGGAFRLLTRHLPGLVCRSCDGATLCPASQ